MKSTLATIRSTHIRIFRSHNHNSLQLIFLRNNAPPRSGVSNRPAVCSHTHTHRNTTRVFVLAISCNCLNLTLLTRASYTTPMNAFTEARISKHVLAAIMALYSALLSVSHGERADAQRYLRQPSSSQCHPCSCGDHAILRAPAIIMLKASRYRASFRYGSWAPDRTSLSRTDALLEHTRCDAQSHLPLSHT